MLHEIISKLEDLVNDIFHENETIDVYADRLGLDRRAGRVTISKDGGFIAATNNRSLEYYGGFEYIDSDDKISIGEWTFYFDTSSRVERALACYFDNLEEDKEEIESEEELEQ